MSASSLLQCHSQLLSVKFENLVHSIFRNENSTVEINVNHFGVLHWQQWQPPAFAPEDTHNLSKFSKVISLLYSSWLLVIYFLELYILILTTVTKISTCNFFFNNNILTQIITFIPVFSSKYVLSKIRNIFLFKKSKQWFEYLHKHSIMITYFRKAKQTWTTIRKKTLKWK